MTLVDLIFWVKAYDTSTIPFTFPSSCWHCILQKIVYLFINWLDNSFHIHPFGPQIIFQSTFWDLHLANTVRHSFEFHFVVTICTRCLLLLYATQLTKLLIQKLSCKSIYACTHASASTAYTTTNVDVDRIRISFAYKRKREIFSSSLPSINLSAIVFFVSNFGFLRYYAVYIAPNLFIIDGF